MVLTGGAVEGLAVPLLTGNSPPHLHTLCTISYLIGNVSFAINTSFS